MATAMLSTLRHVTEKKLAKLDEQRNRFNEKATAAVTAAEKEEAVEDKVKTLLEGCEKHNITIDPTRSGVSVNNVRKHFLAQAKHDPSVSGELQERWRQQILHDLKTQGLKYEYASLFGRLVTEWIESPNDLDSPGSLPSGGSKPTDDADSTTSFEQIGREEMHEQRKEWEGYAFNAKKVDEKKISQYLEDLFGSLSKSKKLKKTPLELLRKSLANFDETAPQKFDESLIRSCIAGILKADLFDGAKREALVDLQSRKEVLKEMSDVLNMELESLDDWHWDPPHIPVSMRRQINGKYRVFMDEELHQAIMLQFIGAKLAVLLKTSFKAFFNSGAWLVTPYMSMTRRDRARRNYFLGSSSRTRADDTVRNKRRTMYAQDYFMTQLPDVFVGGGRDYEDDESDDTEDKDEQRKNPMMVKQSLLRLATTESYINTKLYGQFTIVQSDFKHFGPSLPHSTIFAVLKFFGVKAKWLKFFKTFLEAPLIFEQDGPDAEVHHRRCGIPMSHILSDALGEAVLFCLDFAVNQRTKGGNIYRFHDDLWFWGQESVCIDAWKAMKEFTDVMGLELNPEKTGAIQIASSGLTPTPAAALPKGKIRWGFLTLDQKSGRWLIDKEEVKEHITELRRQLGACRSILAWIQAYNSYVDRFFRNNFGLPARCLGRKHVKMLIEAFEYIHHSIFIDDQDASENSVTEHLRNVIKKRFGVSDIPDGFFYLPVELGGLELRSPFIPLFAQADHPWIEPVDRIDRAFLAEEEAYEGLKTTYDEGDVSRPADNNGYKPDGDEPFMSLKEFTKFREETSQQLCRVYDELLNPSPDDVVEATPEIEQAVRSLPGDISFGAQGFSTYWSNLSFYWKWVLELYAPELLRRFGGLTMSNQELLPVNLLKMLRNKKVRWLS